MRLQTETPWGWMLAYPALVAMAGRRPTLNSIKSNSTRQPQPAPLAPVVPGVIGPGASRLCRQTTTRSRHAARPARHHSLRISALGEGATSPNLHAAALAPSKGWLIVCTVDAATPKRAAILHTLSPVVLRAFKASRIRFSHHCRIDRPFDGPRDWRSGFISRADAVGFLVKPLSFFPRVPHLLCANVANSL